MNPVPPSSFQSLIPVSGGSVCDKFQKIFVSLPTLFSQWYSYTFNEDGSFTTEFSRDICSINCASLPPLVGGSGTLGTPTLTQIAPLSNSAISFSWTAIPNADVYELARNTEPDLLSAHFIGTTVNTTIADATVSAGTWYYYWLQARNSSPAASAFSPMLAAFSSTASSLALPGAPTVSATTTLGTPSVTVTWTAVQGATSYDVYRNGSNTNVAATKIGTVTGLYFNDYSGGAGNSFYYLVTASNYQQSIQTPNGSGALGTR